MAVPRSQCVTRAHPGRRLALSKTPQGPILASQTQNLGDVGLEVRIWRYSKDKIGMAGAPSLAIVIPCYNEEDVLPETCRRMVALVGELADQGKISQDSTVYFVDDGSRDQTWALIEQFATEGRHVAGIKLSRNRGHQNALIAGLFSAKGDAIVSIDADLQDDIGAIREMVDPVPHRRGNRLRRPESTQQ